MLTKQDVFQHLYDHFVRDEAPWGMGYMQDAVDFQPRMVCKYFGVDGARCAVGLFLPDVPYKMVVNQTPLPRLVHDYFPSELNVQGVLNPLGFWSRLQAVHDYNARDDKRDGFARDLLTIAEEHGITIQKGTHAAQ